MTVRDSVDFFSCRLPVLSFRPQTALDRDIYDAFHHFKAQGDGVMLFVDNTFDGEHSFMGMIFKEPVADPNERRRLFYDAIREINRGDSNQVLVALDLSVSFDGQWPYQPGLLSPLPLRGNPVLPLKPDVEVLGPDSGLQDRVYGAFNLSFFFPEIDGKRPAPLSQASSEEAQQAPSAQRSQLAATFEQLSRKEAEALISNLRRPSKTGGQDEAPESPNLG